MKASDYICNLLLENNIKNIFCVTGGTISHILNSIKNNNNFEIIFNYHEQGASMACEGYSRTSNNLPLLLVSNGPACSNVLNGVISAFQESVPFLIISGQCYSTQTVEDNDKKLRQLGVQELNIIPIVKSFTKYSHSIRNINNIKYIFDKAIYYANEGRKGPVWIEIPLDIQSKIIDINTQNNFKLPKQIKDDFNFDFIYNKIIKSTKPITIIGNGIHCSKSNNIINQIIKILKIPVISSWTSKDILDKTNREKYYLGNFGIMGEVAANKAVQSSDLLLIFGCRLSLANTGYNSKLFSINSYKIMVDIDDSELNKSTIKIDYKINNDLLIFLNKFYDYIKIKKFSNHKEWIKNIKIIDKKFPTIKSKYKTNKQFINSYYFIDLLSETIKDNTCIVTDMGTSYTCTMQAFKIKKNNIRLFTSSASCSMGFGLPGIIGSYYSRKYDNYILITGDGGFQMNIQELQCINHNKIPIKIFLLNNNGYAAIKNMQKNLFNDNFIGCHKESGVSNPSFKDIASAYNIEYVKLTSQDDLKQNIDKIINFNKSILCELIIDNDQYLLPKVQSYIDTKGNIVSGNLKNMLYDESQLLS